MARSQIFDSCSACIYIDYTYTCITSCIDGLLYQIPTLMHQQWTDKILINIAYVYQYIQKHVISKLWATHKETETDEFYSLVFNIEFENNVSCVMKCVLYINISFLSKRSSTDTNYRIHQQGYFNMNLFLHNVHVFECIRIYM